MRPRVDLAEALSGQVGVELGGADASMAEERLDHPKIGSPLQQMRRKTVPEGVWSDARGYPRHACPATHQLPDGLAREIGQPTMTRELCSR